MPSIVVVLILVPGMVGAINWETGGLDFTLSSELYYQDVTGNEEKSVLEEGSRYNVNLILDLNQRLTEGIKFQGYSHVRGSNDPQHQIAERDLMFVEGYLRLYNDRYELWGGDYAESFTPYTLTTSLLGAKGFYHGTDWLKISVLGGRNRDEEVDDFVRYSAGGRVELSYREYVTIGGTFIHSDVDEHSLTADSSVGDQLNQVYGGDIKLSLLKDRLHFEAEYARSLYNDDERDQSLRDQYANAVLVKGDITPLNRLTIRGEFERVETWFNSVLGSASPDLQRVKGEVEYAPWDVMSMTLLHEFSFDKVDDHSLAQDRTHTHLTSFTSNITPFLQQEDIWNSLSLDLQIDYSRYYSKNRPRTTDQDDLIAHAAFSQSFPHWNYSLGYTYSRNWNEVDRTSEYFSHLPALSLGVTYPWLALDWTWMFNGSYEYRERIALDSTDRIYRGEVGVSINYASTKSTFTLNLLSEYYDNGAQNELADNFRHAYSGTFEQVLKETEAFAATLMLRVSYMDYNEDVPREDYSEAVYYGSLNLKF